MEFDEFLLTFDEFYVGVPVCFLYEEDLVEKKRVFPTSSSLHHHLECKGRS
jgi:hypothetical protein